MVVFYCDLFQIKFSKTVMIILTYPSSIKNFYDQKTKSDVNDNVLDKGIKDKAKYWPTKLAKRDAALIIVFQD